LSAYDSFPLEGRLGRVFWRGCYNRQSLGGYGFRERADKKEYGLPTWENLPRPSEGGEGLTEKRQFETPVVYTPFPRRGGPNGEKAV